MKYLLYTMRTGVPVPDSVARMPKSNIKAMISRRIKPSMMDGVMETLDPIQSGLVQTLAKVDTLLDNVNEVMDQSTMQDTISLTI